MACLIAGALQQCGGLHSSVAQELLQSSSAAATLLLPAGRPVRYNETEAHCRCTTEAVQPLAAPAGVRDADAFALPLKFTVRWHSGT